MVSYYNLSMWFVIVGIIVGLFLIPGCSTVSNVTLSQSTRHLYTDYCNKINQSYYEVSGSGVELECIDKKGEIHIYNIDEIMRLEINENK